MYDNIHTNSFGIIIYRHNGEVQLVPWSSVEQIKLEGKRICVHFQTTHVWLTVPAPLDLMQSIFEDRGDASRQERVALALERLAGVLHTK